MMLADETGDMTAQRFLDEYLGLLPRRQDRIIRELADGDVGKAMDAILSLRTTSAMAGAVRLSSYCQYLQDELALGNIADRTKTSAVLAILAGAFVQAVNGN